MTEFEKWFKENTPQDKSINENTVFSYRFVKDAFDYAFHKGNENCSLVNCGGRENGIQLRKAKTIIKKLCNCIRALNNPNTQLTDVDGFLKEFEEFTE